MNMNAKLHISIASRSPFSIYVHIFTWGAFRVGWNRHLTPEVMTIGLHLKPVVSSFLLVHLLQTIWIYLKRL